MKNIFLFLDSITPRIIAKLPYSTAFFIVRFSLRFNNSALQIWTRHSIELGTFVLGISDLDLTVMSKTFTRSQFQKITKKLSFWKKIFIFLGESNFYFQDTIKDFLHIANPIEIARDPKLKIFYTLPPSEEEHYFVFIFRNLFADKKNLINNPKIRQKKWASHFKDNPISKENMSFFDDKIIIKALTEFSGIKDPSHKDEWAKAFAYILNIEELNEDVYSNPRPALVSVLIPHHTMWNHDSLASLKHLTSFQKKVLEKQLEWEIWGLYTQLPLLTNNDQILNHLKNLQIVATSIENHSLSQSFDSLIILWIKSFQPTLSINNLS